MVPSPVLALLLLFPTTDASAAASKAGEHSPIMTSLKMVRKLHVNWLVAAMQLSGPSPIIADRHHHTREAPLDGHIT